MASTMTRRRNSVIAAAAGAVLLIGGSTYALWTDSATLEGGTITSGDLNLDIPTNSVSSYDVSVDREDSMSEGIAGQVGASLLLPTLTEEDHVKTNDSNHVLWGHEVDLGTWRMAPGDTVAVVMPVTITLKGDNLVATLTMDTTSLPSTGAGNADMTYRFGFFKPDGNQVGATALLTPGEEAFQIALLQANGAGQGGDLDWLSPGVPVTTVDADGTSEFTLVVFGYFDYDALGSKAVSDNLTALPLTLTQVRGETDQFGD